MSYYYKVNFKYSEMYAKLIICIIYQLFTNLENEYLGNYWALKNGLPLILFTMDIEKRCMHCLTNCQ